MERDNIPDLPAWGQRREYRSRRSGERRTRATDRTAFERVPTEARDRSEGGRHARTQRDARTASEPTAARAPPSAVPKYLRSVLVIVARLASSAEEGARDPSGEDEAPWRGTPSRSTSPVNTVDITSASRQYSITTFLSIYDGHVLSHNRPGLGFRILEGVLTPFQNARRRDRSTGLNSRFTFDES
jgi:hypothetical protein